MIFFDFHLGIEYRSMWTWEQNINQCDAFSNNIYARSHSLTIYLKIIKLYFASMHCNGVVTFIFKKKSEL